MEPHVSYTDGVYCTSSEYIAMLCQEESVCIATGHAGDCYTIVLCRRSPICCCRVRSTKGRHNLWVRCSDMVAQSQLASSIGAPRKDSSSACHSNLLPSKPQCSVRRVPVSLDQQQPYTVVSTTCNRSAAQMWAQRWQSDGNTPWRGKGVTHITRA